MPRVSIAGNPRSLGCHDGLVTIERLLGGTEPNLAAFLNTAHDLLARQFDLDVAVLASVDPASGLETSCEVAGMPADPDRELRIFELEWFADEPLRYIDLARSPNRAGALRLAADPTEVRRYIEIFQPHGGYDELRLACVADGMWWGTFSGYRMVGKPGFTPKEVSQAAALSQPLARAFRRAFLHAAVNSPGRMEEPPGAFVIDEDGHQLTTTGSAESLLSRVRPERIETVCRALAATARQEGCSITMNIGEDGGSLTFHADAVKGADGQISVVVEHPRPIQLTPLIVGAYQLSPREREVTQLVLEGLQTKQIARRLQISEYTVQDHLKSVFAKTGTATRGELSFELFTRFYRPYFDQGTSPGPYGYFLMD